MRLAMLYGFALDLARALSIGLPPTLRAVWRRPGLLLRPRAVSRAFMAHVWEEYGPGIDASTRAEKAALVSARARGVVLDVGAGHGHLAAYLDHTLVTAYVALEPNTHMHARLRANAAAAGFSEGAGSFLLLPCGAGDVRAVRGALRTWAAGVGRAFVAPEYDSRGDGEGHGEGDEGDRDEAGEGEGPIPVIDTLVLVLTLCSIPAPARALRGLVRGVLRGGGQLLFFEHVRSPRADVRWWQDALAPVWRCAFDGCVIGLDGVRVVRGAAGAGGRADGADDGDDRDDDGDDGGIGGWAEMETWGIASDDPDNLFWHQAGRCVKKA